MVMRKYIKKLIHIGDQANLDYSHLHSTEILNVAEIGYIFDELWQGKSVISGAQDRMLVMTRWDKTKVANLVNTIVLTKEEAIEHDKLAEGTDLKAHYGSEVFDRVEKQFSLEKKLEEMWNTATATSL
jgi:hypothetical protein